MKPVIKSLVIFVFLLQSCTSSRLSYDEYLGIIKKHPDYESKSDRKFVELIPKGYDRSMNIFSELLSAIKSAFSKVEYYYTSNPNYFWEQ
jgi:hypothetical protein